MALVNFLNFLLLKATELSSITEYISGSRYLQMKQNNNKNTLL